MIIISYLILMTIVIIAIIVIAIIHHRLCTRYRRKFEELDNMYSNLNNIQRQLVGVLVNKTNWYTRPIINEEEIHNKFKELQYCLFDIKDELYNIDTVRNVARFSNNFQYIDDVPYLQQLGNVELKLAKATALTQILGCHLSEA